MFRLLRRGAQMRLLKARSERARNGIYLLTLFGEAFWWKLVYCFEDTCIDTTECFIKLLLHPLSRVLRRNFSYWIDFRPQSSWFLSFYRKLLSYSCRNPVTFKRNSMCTSSTTNAINLNKKQFSWKFNWNSFLFSNFLSIFFLFFFPRSCWNLEKLQIHNPPRWKPKRLNENMKSLSLNYNYTISGTLTTRWKHKSVSSIECSNYRRGNHFTSW